jgi:hypothetical protein
MDDTLFGTPQYPDREKVLNESTYLSPNSLGAFSFVTHVPLVHEGVEDALFFAFKDQLENWLDSVGQTTSLYDDPNGRNSDPKLTILGKTGRLILSNKIEKLLENFPRLSQFSVPEMEKLAGDIANVIDKHVLDLVREKPEYWLFSCHSLIMRHINRRTIREIGARIDAAVGDDKPPGSKKIEQTMQICDFCILQFNRLLRLNAHTVRESIDRLIETIRRSSDTLPQPPLGGIVSAFEAMETSQHVSHSRETDPSTKDMLKITRAQSRAKIQTFDNDFVELDLSGNKDTHPAYGASGVKSLDFHYKLRWYRSNQFWNYTFFESWKCKSPSFPAIPGDEIDAAAGHALFESPHINLAQQNESVKAAYTQDIAQYLAMVLRFMNHPDVTQSPFVSDQFNSLAHSRRFPGRLLAGAHYAFVPLGILVLILYFPKYCLNLAESQPEVRRDQDKVAFAEISKRASCIGKTKEYSDFIDILLQISRSPEHIKRDALCDLIADLQKSVSYKEEIPGLAIPPRPNVITIGTLMDLGYEIWLRVSRSSAMARRFGPIVSRFCLDLWNMTNTPDHKAPFAHGANHRDFVSCYVIDRRSVYFTNFYASGKDGFTRTYFIDLAAQGYQRGRLAQRLCDIATYRSISIRDINRVRAMIRGMDELGGELNAINHGNSSVLVAPDVGGAEDADVQKGLIVRLDTLQRRLDQMNSFIIYGVRGKFLSANAYLAQIGERSRDIRQERIMGFPMLSDFLERRVASLVREVARMDEHHEDLRRRVRDAFERVRTRLNSIETSRISIFLARSINLTEDMRKASQALAAAAGPQAELLNEHAKLALTANIIGLSIGTAAIYDLLGEIVLGYYPELRQKIIFIASIMGGLTF